MISNFIQSCNCLGNFLEETKYKLVYDTYKLGYDRSFVDIHGILKVINPHHAFLVSLFRLNHKIEGQFLDFYLDKALKEVMIELGILIGEKDVYRLNDLVLVVRDGLYIFQKTPSNYPTNEFPEKYPILNPLNTNALPSSLDGKSVVELESVNGLLGLACAQRGATNVLIECNEISQVSILKCNIGINKLANVSIISSDELKKRIKLQSADIVLSAPLTLPGIWVSDEYPSMKGGFDGMTILKRLFSKIEDVPLRDGFSIMLFGIFIGSQGYVPFNEHHLIEFLKIHQMKAECLITIKNTLVNHVDEFLEASKTDWDRIAGVDISNFSDLVVKWIDMLKDEEKFQDFVYQQIIVLRDKNESDKELITYQPYYLSTITDPLFNISFFSQLKQKTK